MIFLQSQLKAKESSGLSARSLVIYSFYNSKLYKKHSGVKDRGIFDALEENQTSPTLQQSYDIINSKNKPCDQNSPPISTFFMLKQKFLHKTNRQDSKSYSQNKKSDQFQINRSSLFPFAPKLEGKKLNANQPSTQEAITGVNLMRIRLYDQMHRQTRSYIKSNQVKTAKSLEISNQLDYQFQKIPAHLQTLDMYAIVKQLGSGATAEVKLAKHKTLNLEIAMKVYDKKKIGSQFSKNLEREINILYSMDHPNIIKLYHTISNEKNIYLIMEYTSPVCLNTFTRGRPYKRLAEDEAKPIIKQIIDAIAYFHSLNILHRDLKLENILIDSSTKRIKVIDFGYSVRIQPNIKAQTSCGTPQYMAPEIIKKTGYLFKADVWSCGVIIYRIITGKFPFCGNNEKELFKKVTQGKFDYPSFVGYKIRSLISQMLRIDEDERISIFEVQQHPWFIGQ